jgi:hypothetical protein
MSARADLCGGRSEMIVPTATSLSTTSDFRSSGRMTATRKLPQNRVMSGWATTHSEPEKKKLGTATTIKRTVPKLPYSGLA